MSCKVPDIPIAALAVHKTRRAAKLRLDRDDDIVMTGKRHDFQIGWEVGFDNDGKLSGAAFDLASRCGHSSSSNRDRHRVLRIGSSSLPHVHATTRARRSCGSSGNRSSACIRWRGVGTFAADEGVVRRGG